MSSSRITVQQELNIFEGVIRSFEALINPLSGAQLTKHVRSGAYEYIPLPLERFLMSLTAARAALPKNRTQAPSFIDVGCGIGTKVLLAKQMGFIAHGIEVNREYVRVARDLLVGHGPRWEAPATIAEHKANAAKRVIHGDARKHDYSPYDVIYFYCPRSSFNQKNGSDEVALEERILSTAKPGAVILAHLAHHDELRWDKSAYPYQGKKPSRTEWISGNVYKMKGSR